MYWDWDHNNPDIKERVYAESAVYGIQCRVQDLQEIVNGLNKYIKKTKVRGAGLNIQFGVLNPGGFGISDSCWKEWLLDMGASKKNALTAEQGLFWYFSLKPNRHFHIDADGKAREVFFFPDRKEFHYIVSLYKHNYFYFRNGQIVNTDNEDIRLKREIFFQGLLDSIGFPLEVLHVYDRDEESWGCPLWGTWERVDGEWKKYSPNQTET